MLHAISEQFWCHVILFSQIIQVNSGNTIQSDFMLTGLWLLTAAKHMNNFHFYINLQRIILGGHDALLSRGFDWIAYSLSLSFFFFCGQKSSLNYSACSVRFAVAHLENINVAFMDAT